MLNLAKNVATSYFKADSGRLFDQIAVFGSLHVEWKSTLDTMESAGFMSWLACFYVVLEARRPDIDSLSDHTTKRDTGRQRLITIVVG